jgi:hypothetical protein
MSSEPDVPIPAAPQPFGPDEKEALRQQAITWLNQHWLEPRMCPICHTRIWAVNDPIIVDVYSGPERRLLGGPAYVFVPVACSTCAYTMMFNAVQMGLIPGDNPPSPNDG